MLAEWGTYGPLRRDSNPSGGSSQFQIEIVGQCATTQSTYKRASCRQEEPVKCSLSEFNDN